MSENTLILPLLSDEEDKSSPLKNRIRKNYRHIRKWAKRTQTDCFRIYDRDIKEYPLAIDFYAGRFCVYFFSTDRENDEPRSTLKEEADQALFSLFGATSEKVYWKVRKRRAKTQQYEKVDEEGKFFIVHEHGVKFKINFSDYLDTGLFLDHRETRQMVAKLSQRKKVLNLFAYTCSFSMHAALGGALYTKSVDLSNTYTTWGKENFLINSISLKNNEIVRDDCLKFMKEEIRSSNKYDIIIVDPPTLSRSKKMDQLFDIQVDYILLLKDALKLLSPKGCIFFSTNSRKFVFDATLFENCQIRDISEKTIPLDFHNHKIHRCWMITKMGS